MRDLVRPHISGTRVTGKYTRSPVRTGYGTEGSSKLDVHRTTVSTRERKRSGTKKEMSRAAFGWDGSRREITPESARVTSLERGPHDDLSWLRGLTKREWELETGYPLCVKTKDVLITVGCVGREELRVGILSTGSTGRGNSKRWDTEGLRSLYIG